jgi:hypothetical protein
LLGQDRIVIYASPYTVCGAATPFRLNAPSGVSASFPTCAANVLEGLRIPDEAAANDLAMRRGV